jgi:protein SCO1/2
VLFVAAGVGLYVYFRHEKAKLLEKRRACLRTCPDPTDLIMPRLLEKELEAKEFGRAHVGGPFTLTTTQNKPFSELDLLGKWSLLYFGFTNCPDICPAELDKIGAVMSALGTSVVCLTPALHYNGTPHRKRLRDCFPTRFHFR